MKQLIKNIPVIYNLFKYLRNKKNIMEYNRTVKKNQLRIQRDINNSNDIKIVIGASNVFDNNWIPTDQYNLDLLKTDSFKKLFKTKKATVFLAEHVWEHLTLDDGLIAIKNCYQYLDQGGYMRIAVPDGLHIDKNYIQTVDVGGTGEGSDDHKVLYTYKTLSEIFIKAGFKVELLEYFDENGKFHQTDWNKNKGMIHRSTRYDERNTSNPTAYISIIIDAIKL